MCDKDISVFHPACQSTICQSTDACQSTNTNQNTTPLPRYVTEYLPEDWVIADQEDVQAKPRARVLVAGSSNPLLLESLSAMCGQLPMLDFLYIGDEHHIARDKDKFAEFLGTIQHIRHLRIGRENDLEEKRVCCLSVLKNLESLEIGLLNHVGLEGLCELVSSLPRLERLQIGLENDICPTPANPDIQKLFDSSSTLHCVRTRSLFSRYLTTKKVPVSGKCIRCEVCDPFFSSNLRFLRKKEIN